ncbi:MAG: nitroreductase family protein [Dissulfurimicrobium hydrothermale]
MSNPVLDAIYSRRSIRQFTDEPVDREAILEIIRAGTWAPSGLNNQPWRFAIVTDRSLKSKFEGLTRYAKVIASAKVLIAVFVDKAAMYSDVKDYQAIGACLQNMLLAAHSLGLGAVWLGEILKNANKARALLELPGNLELMAVVAVGYPLRRNQSSERMGIDQVIVFDR